MKINRHNYEEYFILYTDNELSSADRSLVEIFVQQNPDLEEELVMLQQSKLIPDESLVFDDKAILMKQTGDVIGADNYEEWLLLYNDHELTPAQRTTVEDFIAVHPQAKTELEWLQKAKLVREEAIVFPGKESLYRRDEKVRVIPVRWWRIAAAAVLLFAVSTTAFLLLNRDKDQSSEEIASGAPAKKESVQKNTEVVKTDDPQQKNNTPVIENSGNLTEEKIAITNKNIPVKKTDKIKKDDIAVIVKEEELLAKEEDKNNLPQPTYNPNMKGSIEENNALVKTDIIAEDVLTKLKQSNTTSLVTKDIINTSLLAENETALAEQPEKKNKLRGLFRRVTRTFEKTTGVKATDEDDRLLVGGLAIKL